MYCDYLSFWLMILLNTCFSSGIIFITIKQLEEIQRLQKENRQSIAKMNEAIREFEGEEDACNNPAQQ